MVDDAKLSWAERVLGIQFGQPPRPSAMAAWITARKVAVDSLNTLIAAIRGGEDPDGDSAIILLRAIRAQLIEEPATPRQVQALKSYLTADELVQVAEVPNAYGVPIDLRRPLLGALAQLEAQI